MSIGVEVGNPNTGSVQDFEALPSPRLLCSFTVDEFCHSAGLRRGRRSVKVIDDDCTLCRLLSPMILWARLEKLKSLNPEHPKSPP